MMSPYTKPPKTSTLLVARETLARGLKLPADAQIVSARVGAFGRIEFEIAGPDVPPGYVVARYGSRGRFLGWSPVESLAPEK